MNPLFIIIPAFFVAFPLFWICIIKLILKISGLTGLQEKYPLRAIIDYRKYTPHNSRNGRFNKANFNGTLTLHYNEDYLIIEMMKIFSFGFNGLQIPIDEVEYLGESSVFFYKYSKFKVGSIEMQLAGDCSQLLKLVQKKAASK